MSSLWQKVKTQLKVSRYFLPFRVFLITFQDGLLHLNLKKEVSHNFHNSMGNSVNSVLKAIRWNTVTITLIQIWTNAFPFRIYICKKFLFFIKNFLFSHNKFLINVFLCNVFFSQQRRVPLVYLGRCTCNLHTCVVVNSICRIPSDEV